MKKIENRKSKIENFRAFTLIELLVVISIISVLAAFTIPVLGKIKEAQYKKAARAELVRIELALDNYKAKYGTYPPSNQNNNNTVYKPSGFDRSQYSQLYYELVGTTNNGNLKAFVTLDGSSQILANDPGHDVKQAYGVGGFINCNKGGDEDAVKAVNFLSGLRENQVYYQVTNNGVPTTVLATSVGGPDASYQPLKAPGLNPFRYIYPGTNNPTSYDLWVQLVIKGKTNLICNWSRQVQINSPLP